MGLRREMNHRVDVVFFEHRGTGVSVADVCLDKSIPFVVFNGGQVVRVSRVGERVEVDDVAVFV
jgi:predicted RNA-binding protein